MTPPLVSVAMATYDGERFLREQLDTIYEQTWPNLEVVVSDDRSSDGTVEILEEYRSRRGLRYSVAERRLGLVRNFARAISLCQGELVTLSDQDDLWKPERVERLVEGLAPDFSLCYCFSHEYVVEGGSVFPEERYRPIRDWALARGTGRVTDRLLAENWVVSHGMLFRRELVSHALPIPPHQRFHDGWLALVASRLGGGLRYMDESLQVYRLHPGSYTYQEPEERAGPPLRRVLGGDFGATWPARCRAEIARLEDASDCHLLDRSNRSFLADLLRYYRSGVTGGLDLRAFALGLRLAPYFASNHGGGRTRMALKGLLGGWLAMDSAEPAAS